MALWIVQNEADDQWWTTRDRADPVRGSWATDLQDATLFSDRTQAWHVAAAHGGVLVYLAAISIEEVDENPPA